MSDGDGLLTRSQWPVIKRMWDQDATTLAIAQALAITPQHVRTQMGQMRKAGWDLPRRRISDEGAETCAEAGRRSAGGGRHPQSPHP